MDRSDREIERLRAEVEQLRQANAQPIRRKTSLPKTQDVDGTAFAPTRRRTYALVSSKSASMMEDVLYHQGHHGVYDDVQQCSRSYARLLIA
eukprot:5883324-Amphidinium_carterae.1